MDSSLAASVRLRCDPTDYARRQQEKKDRAKDIREQRQRGVCSDEHTFIPKVNPARAAKPSSREEDERPMMQNAAPPSGYGDDAPIRPSKSLGVSRKETLGPEEAAPLRSAAASSLRAPAVSRSNGNRRPNNNADDNADPVSDSLDTLSRHYVKKAATRREPEEASPILSSCEPEHDSLYREVKKTTGQDLDDVPIAKLNAQAVVAVAYSGPCLRNSNCGCPQCRGGLSAPAPASRPDPPARLRGVRRDAEPSESSRPAPAMSSSRASHSEIESSLTLLKSKMSRMKARSAPSNQASLFLEKAPRVQPTAYSAREPAASSSIQRGPSPVQQAPSAAPPRKPARQSHAAAPPQHKQEDEVDEPMQNATRYPPPISTGFSSGEQPSEYADGGDTLEECEHCHRRFNVSSLEKHLKICEKVFAGPRKVFNMAAKRLGGTEAEKLAKESKSKGGSKSASASEQPIKAKAADWKQQSNAFRDAMRANRDISEAIKEGRPPPPMAPSAPDPSLILCDYCGRRFNEKAAERHIPFCKDKTQRDAIGRGGPAKKPGGAKPRK